MTAYLTCAQVAEELGVSVRTITRWIDTGALEAVRLPGGRLRVSQTALAAHLAGWSTSSATGAYAGPVDASGPATRQRPGPDTEGLAPCN
jgi:excisionase family DNA binding protein